MLRTTWCYDRNNILLAENLGEFYKKATTILFMHLESELWSQKERIHPLPLLHLPPLPMLCPVFQPPMVRILWNIIGQVSLQDEESDKNLPDEQLWPWTPPSWISTGWRKTGDRTWGSFSGWGRRKRVGRGVGVDSVVLRRGHWRIAPPSTKARCQTRK